jgi:transcriptional regulator of acetoin/glycerol metabolism
MGGAVTDGDPAKRVRRGHRQITKTAMATMASPVRTSAGSVKAVVDAAMSE